MPSHHAEIEALVEKAIACETMDENENPAAQYSEAMEGLKNALNFPFLCDVVARNQEIPADLRSNAVMTVIQEAAHSSKDFKYVPAASMLTTVCACPNYYYSFNTEQQYSHLALVLGMSCWNKKTEDEEIASIFLLSRSFNQIYRHCPALTATDRIAGTDTLFDLIPEIKSENAKSALFSEQVNSIMSRSVEIDVPAEEFHRLLYRFAQQPDFDRKDSSFRNLRHGMSQITAYTHHARENDPFLKEIGWSPLYGAVIELYEKTYGKPNPA